MMTFNINGPQHTDIPLKMQSNAPVITTATALPSVCPYEHHSELSKLNMFIYGKQTNYQ